MSKIIYLYGEGRKVRERLQRFGINQSVVDSTGSEFDIWIGKDDNCVVATDKKKILGLWVFELRRKQNQNRAQSYGTIVKLPRQGIAKKLWKTGIKRYNLKTISVTTVSDRGETLVRSLKESFPDIEFRHDEKGSRTLRDLRKIKRKQYDQD